MFHYLQATTPESDPLGTYLSSYGLGPANELKEGFKNVFKTIQTMDTEMGKFVKTMGGSVAQGIALKNNFSLAYQEVVDLGGKLSDVTAQQESLLNVTGRNLISLKSQSKELFAAVSVTGLKAEELQTAFYNAGMETAHIAENVLTMVRVSNQLGVSAQAVAGTVTTNLDKLNRFGFTNGVEGLSKMAGKAQGLRFDVTQTFDLADRLMSPEKAIETAAAIQRLGGAATALNDPLKLMDLAQNDVGGLQDELGKLAKQYTYFDEKSQSFQIMPGARRQLKEVADALGIDRKEFEKMALETSKLEDKMSKIRFPDLDMGKEDKELFANLAQLQDTGGGKKEYVINYKDKNNEMQTVALSNLDKLSSAQLEEIKKQSAADAAEAGEDPQTQLVNIAKKQLTSTEALVAANEKIANTASITLGGSKAGDEMLKQAAETSLKFANNIVLQNFGPKSEFKTKLDEMGEAVGDLQNLLINLASGDIVKVFKSLEGATAVLGPAVVGVGTSIATEFKTALSNQLLNLQTLTATVSSGSFNITAIKNLREQIKTEEGKSGGDGFKSPRVGGDTLKTPSGDIVLHDKDYFLAATQLPDVLQKSVNKGLMDVLKIERQSMNAAMMSTNTQNQSQPQKQEVTHTVNFKVSVDTPRNKLTDMLVEELPKNPTLMQYIVKHFDNTKTSNGMISKK